MKEGLKDFRDAVPLLLALVCAVLAQLVGSLMEVRQPRSQGVAVAEPTRIFFLAT